MKKKEMDEEEQKKQELAKLTRLADGSGLTKIKNRKTLID
jgi:hypothetical protein